MGQRLEWKTFDIRANLLAKPAATSSEVVLILVDQDSLDWARQNNGLSWPWPREIWAHILDFCQTQGARAVGFDILFTEPSFYGVYDDEAFAAASRRMEAVTGALFLGKSTGAATGYPETYPAPPPFHGDPPEIRPRAALPVPVIATGWRLLGNVGLDPDPDGVYRNLRPFTAFDGRVFPSLGLATWLAAHPHNPVRLEANAVFVGERRIPLHKGEARLRFRGPSRTHPSIPAAAVLRAAILEMQGREIELPEAGSLKNAYVLVGYSAPGLHDLTPTPVGGGYPGVEVHATLLDNFLAQDFLETLHPAVSFTLMLALSGICALVIVLLPATAVALAVLATACILPGMLAFFFYTSGLVLPLLPLMFSALLSTVTALFINYNTEGRQKRFIKNAFSQYLSPAVIDELLLDPGKLKLGGEKREITIFFSDLEGFTRISEGLDPESLTSFLNHYLSAMTDIILHSGGTVDKYEGDAIIAFWNAPLSFPDHADRAVQAALRCQDTLASMSHELRRWTEKPVRMRIGINTGPAVVGNLGSKKRFDYTMLGDAVNLAARLEGVNKVFGTYTLISESTALALGPGIDTRELARVLVVGKEYPIRIFEPFWSRLHQNHDEPFARGLALFYAGDLQRAMETFQSIGETDAPARAYVGKCQALLKNPQENWEGVWVMDQK
jgi:adenylate cyclase